MHRLVDQLQERFRALETEFHRAYWDSQTAASPANDHRRAELELELRRVKGDAAALEAITAALQEPLHEPVLARQLEVLRLSLTGNQMDDAQRADIVSLSTAIESDFASFRPEVGGRRLSNNDIEEVLRSSDDSDQRQAVWMASKEVGGLVAERIRELARVRNQVARNQGFADYYKMSLELQEMTEEWLFSLLGELDDLTRPSFEQWKGKLDDRLQNRFGIAELSPWHYSDPFFQRLPPDGAVSLDGRLENLSAEELATATFRSWGIDLTGVIARSDLYPRENKSQHAFCLDVDRTGADVRILANIVPGEHWVTVMLHESGHAAYDVSIDPRLPYLLRRPAHTFTTEAIAIMSGRFVRDPDWLSGMAGISADAIGDLKAELQRADAAERMLFARWVLVMSHFERDLYDDPEADLDARWWDLVESFQLVSRPPGREAPDWAAKIHLAAAPVYYHNYLLGELLASQLTTAVTRDCGGLAGNPEAGRWLKQRVFEPGARMRWDVLIETATGRSLSPEDFAHSLAV